MPDALKFPQRTVLLTMHRTVLVLVLSTALFGAPDKLAKDLHQANPGTFLDVVIQWSKPPGPVHHAKVAAQGGALKQSFTVIKAGLYSVPAAALNGLAHDPEIVFISPDRKHSAFRHY